MKYAARACLALALLAASAAAWSSDFRVYRANDDMQLDLIPVFNEDEPGCHNMLLTLTVYRVAQIGYQYCSVYAEKDCKPGSEIQVSWKKEKEPVTQFTQGDRWFLVSDERRGHKMGSWYCEARE